MAFTTNLSKRSSISNNLSNHDTSVANGVGGEGNWGMGFLLVFFPQEQHQKTQHEFNTTLFKRSNSSHILSKTQSTLSICVLLVFVTLLLFTLSTFEPNKSSSNRYHHYRRYLSDSHVNFYSKKFEKKYLPALQRLGTLYSRGTKAMHDLVLCHVSEHVTTDEMKMFLRAFHRSGLFSRSDLLFIFESFRTPDYFDNVIRAENKLFLKLVELSNASKNATEFSTSFDVTQFTKSGKKEMEKEETIWGRKHKTGLNSSLSTTELTRTSYGSVVGFGVGELDPENSLSGFLDHVPMSLRRWASYPMLLGRVRRNFKHIMLVDVKEVLLLGDLFPRVKTSSPETVILSYSQPRTTKQNHKIPEKPQRKTINPQIIIGGGRGVRKLSAAMLTEIVRVSTSSIKKSPSSSLIIESVLLNRLVTNKYLLKSIQLVDSGESIPEASSLSGVEIANNTIVWRANSNLDIEYMKHICSFELEASYYTDCGRLKVQPL